MTFAVGHVAGGTRAGWKRQREKGQPWVCVPCELELRRIGQTLPGYRTTCDRGHRRPNA